MSKVVNETQLELVNRLIMAGVEYTAFMGSGLRQEQIDYLLDAVKDELVQINNEKRT